MCSACSSTSIGVFLDVFEEINIGESTVNTVRTATSRKFIFQSKQGDDLYRKTGRWSLVWQVVDRLRNRYKKLVIDKETGEILKDVDEPLTDHKRDRRRARESS